jgi:death on curing protein
VNSEPTWLLRSVIEAIHDEQIAEHGGASGIRGVGLLDSALARPLNLWAYAKPNVFELAAAYAFGIAKNHPFVDGNKRTAFLAAYLFLTLDGWRLAASQNEAVRIVLRLAAGDMGEPEFANWLESNTEAIS